MAAVSYCAACSKKNLVESIIPNALHLMKWININYLKMILPGHFKN